jgi:alanine racemase
MSSAELRGGPSSQDLERASSLLEIDLGAIAENWRTLRARVGPGVNCAAVVKGDGYGLGAPEVGRALAAAGCRHFFVATLEEGRALRRALPDTDITVLGGFVPARAGEFARAKLVPALNDLGQIAAWRGAARRNAGARAMLQLDTGMNRLGLSPGELAKLIAEPERLAGVTLAGILSHLACAGDPAHVLNETQRQAFATALTRLPPAPASLAASSGIFLGAAYHFEFVRPGAALFGVNPHPGTPNPMRQVVRFKGKILQVRDVDRAESVGYGAAHRMARAGRIATIAVGYADGWLRSASHRGSVGISGKRAPVVGRISMDLLTLDVTGIDPAAVTPGGFVDLLDAEYGVDAAAAAAGTIGYEILTALGRRALRVYLGGPG